MKRKVDNKSDYVVEIINRIMEKSDSLRPFAGYNENSLTILQIERDISLLKKIQEIRKKLLDRK